MKIIVVCGAGASSTFIAQRLQRAARAQGVDDVATAASVQTLAAHVPGADLILVGAHVRDALEEIRSDAAGTRVLVLPDDAAADRDGRRLFAFAHAQDGAPEGREPLGSLGASAGPGPTHLAHPTATATTKTTETTETTRSTP